MNSCMRWASYLMLWKCKWEKHTLCVREGLDWNPASALSESPGMSVTSQNISLPICKMRSAYLM